MRFPLSSAITIPNGTSVSVSLDLNGTVPLSVITPSAWTTAALQIEVSTDNTTWITTVYDATGSNTGLYSTITTSSAYAIDTQSFLAYRYIRLRSGSSASPVTQGADRVFTLISRQLA